MKPSIPRGTRDFSPVEMQKRNYIFDVIKKYFHLYGFAQIETPAMENLSTLTGKYGDEGDKLIFKVLDSGDYIEPIAKTQLDIVKKLLMHAYPTKNKSVRNIIAHGNIKNRYGLKSISETLSSKKLTKEISEKALRYDLTVPFARYVVMHQNEITFPFKRYQIQPVWRADKPQKGRYREFFQCDADMIGSNSLLNEVDLMKLMDDVYTELGLPVTIKINNRKILSGIAEIVGENDKIIDITVAIDKLDKIGIVGVNKELAKKGITPMAIERLQEFINFSVVPLDDEHLPRFKQLFEGQSEIGMVGYKELEFLKNAIKHLNIKHSKIELDITLARGLDYYTGTIFEVKANGGSLGSSITGGGRYDDLTGIFGLKNMSGVGISFGIDRIYDVMNDADLFSKKITKGSTVDIMFLNKNELDQGTLLKYVHQLRLAGISAEVYPDYSKKEQKQFEYAEKKGVPFVASIGHEETEKVFKLRGMENRSNQFVNLEELKEIIQLKKEFKDDFN